MARLAIYIDGGYFDQISRNLGVRVDFAKFVNEIQTVVAAGTSDTLDLLRTYYYDSLPYQSNPPTTDESRRFAAKRSFFEALRRIERFQVREGRWRFVDMTTGTDPYFSRNELT